MPTPIQLSKFGSRIAALVIDILILALIGIILGFTLQDFFIGLGPYGIFVGVILGFDMKSDVKMPISGSPIEVGRKKYRQFNNACYFGTNGSLPNLDYHFPIKLSMKLSKPELLDDLAFARQLVNQIYQFSRM